MLTFAEHPAAAMRPDDRLIGAALSGERGLFAATSLGYGPTARLSATTGIARSSAGRIGPSR